MFTAEYINMQNSRVSLTSIFFVQFFNQVCYVGEGSGDKDLRALLACLMLNAKQIISRPDGFVVLMESIISDAIDG